MGYTLEFNPHSRWRNSVQAALNTPSHEIPGENHGELHRIYSDNNMYMKKPHYEMNGGEEEEKETSSPLLLQLHRINSDNSITYLSEYENVNELKSPTNNASSGYIPKPLDTSHIEVTNRIMNIVEALAQNAHESWAADKMKSGWSYAPEHVIVNENKEDLKLNSLLVPYSHLTEDEKEPNRITAIETVKTLLYYGYEFIPMARKHSVQALALAKIRFRQSIIPGMKENLKEKASELKDFKLKIFQAMLRT